jgi:hypothetical protein
LRDIKERKKEREREREENFAEWSNSQKLDLYASFLTTESRHQEKSPFPPEPSCV